MSVWRDHQPNARKILPAHNAGHRRGVRINTGDDELIYRPLARVREHRFNATPVGTVRRSNSPRDYARARVNHSFLTCSVYRKKNRTFFFLLGSDLNFNVRGSSRRSEMAKRMLWPLFNMSGESFQTSPSLFQGVQIHRAHTTSIDRVAEIPLQKGIAHAPLAHRCATTDQMHD